MTTRILYVDDEPDLREVAVMSLELDPDFEVRDCGSGEAALGIARAWKPALILLDMMMPGMDGPATLRALREETLTGCHTRTLAPPSDNPGLRTSRSAARTVGRDGARRRGGATQLSPGSSAARPRSERSVRGLGLARRGHLWGRPRVGRRVAARRLRSDLEQ